MRRHSLTADGSGQRWAVRSPAIQRMVPDERRPCSRRVRPWRQCREMAWPLNPRRIGCNTALPSVPASANPCAWRIMDGQVLAVRRHVPLRPVNADELLSRLVARRVAQEVRPGPGASRRGGLHRWLRVIGHDDRLFDTATASGVRRRSTEPLRPFGSRRLSTSTDSCQWSCRLLLRPSLKPTSAWCAGWACFQGSASRPSNWALSIRPGSLSVGAGRESDDAVLGGEVGHGHVMGLRRKPNEDQVTPRDPDPQAVRGQPPQ